MLQYLWRIYYPVQLLIQRLLSGQKPFRTSAELHLDRWYLRLLFAFQFVFDANLFWQFCPSECPAKTSRYSAIISDDLG